MPLNHGERDDSRPPFGCLNDAADAGRPGARERLRHHLVGRDHEVFNQPRGGVAAADFEIANIVRVDNGFSFDAIEAFGTLRDLRSAALLYIFDA